MGRERCYLINFWTKSPEVVSKIKLREITQELIQCQMDDGSDAQLAVLQQKLNQKYDSFTAHYGLISSNANRRAFFQDSSYCLLASLEYLDEEGKLERKADIFTKRTIRKARPVSHVDTSSEALAISISERAKVDLFLMAKLAEKTEEELIADLTGVIFKNPITSQWETSDEYLSGNVREKLSIAREWTKTHPELFINVQALENVQPKDLEASEIEVRLGATWIKTEYNKQFMAETFQTPAYLLGKAIQVRYAGVNGQWNILGKNEDSRGNSLITSTYGTARVNAYHLLENTLNLKDTLIYDTKTKDGKEKRVLNKKETMLASQKQEMIKEAFKEWIFKDLERREDLCRTYNTIFNSIRPREYDGIIIGHSQFEKIPLSAERQSAYMERQIQEIAMAIADAKMEEGTRFTIKQMEKTKKRLEERLGKLNSQERKDNVVTFEQLGVDHIFVDESHYYKNCYFFTKMRNVAGIAQTDAQKCSDLLMKCQYLDDVICCEL